MGTHWTDRQAAKALLGGALARAGWSLLGWKPDRSESMTDYYDPASWAGVAEKGGAVVVVDIDAREAAALSGKRDTIMVERVRRCYACSGSGLEPCDVPGVTRRALIGGSVERIPARKKGDPCPACEGKGERPQREPEPDPNVKPWPKIQGNPRGAVYHVEKGGRILAKGSGVFKLARMDYAKRDAAADEIVARVEAALEGGGAETVRAWAPTSVAGVTVRPGTRPGYVEVVFPEKPGASVLDALKAAGFRWARSSGCWYGLEGSLPERMRESATVQP